MLAVVEEQRDKENNLKKVWVEGVRYVESELVLGKEIGGKQNILVMNDEAHHAYRIRNTGDDGDDEEQDDQEYFYKEATVWVEGLNHIHKARGIGAICGVLN